MKVSISAMAARISWTLSCQLLTDTDGLLVDALAHGRPKAARSPQIHSAAKQLFQEQLQSYYAEISRGPAEFHEQSMSLVDRAWSRATEPNKLSDWTANFSLSL